MKVVLFDTLPKGSGCVNKDVAAGFGTRTHVGSSFRARLLEWGKRRSVRIPQLSLGYAASIFRHRRHTVEYRRIGLPDADLVLIPSSLVTYSEDISAAERFRREGRTVGFFGPFASSSPDDFLPQADFVIQGEPEEALLRIADGFVPRGLVVSHPIEDLDRLPFPYWGIFPVKDYSYFPEIRVRPFLTLQSSRGCPFSCGFYCPYPSAQGRRFRHRSVANVVDEIDSLQKTYGLRGLLFRDPIFTYDQKRAAQIAEEILRRNLKIQWGCETHLSCLTTDLLDSFYASGLRALEVGIESSDAQSLSRIRRVNPRLDQQKKILRYCQEKGIWVSAFYILGLPDDTEESIERTLSYAKSLNTPGAQFTLLTPYPGTPFYESLNGNRPREWEKMDAYTPVLDPPLLTKEKLSQLKEEAFVTYYFRWDWVRCFMGHLFQW